MEIQKHDVVQIAPEHHWGGCFAVVSEVKSWGIQGFVQIPMQGQAYIRLKKDEYEKIGSSVFVLNEE